MGKQNILLNRRRGHTPTREFIHSSEKSDEKELQVHRLGNVQSLQAWRRAE